MKPKIHNFLMVGLIILCFYTQSFAQEAVLQNELSAAVMVNDTARIVKRDTVKEVAMMESKELMLDDTVKIEQQQDTEMTDKKERSSGVAINFVQNNVGGFFPVFLGHVNLRPGLNFTWYSVFWTNASFGTLDVGGDLWLETGAGLGFSALDGKLYLNPSLGFTHGKFLSGGEKTVIGDGIVPSILTLYNEGRFEFEFYLAYYKSLRNEGPVTRDFILNWAAPGVKVSNHLSLGAFYEQFVLTRATEGKATSIYQWLGAYVKIPVGKGSFVRLAAGKNLYNQAAVGEEFYKINAFISLN